MTRYMIRAIVLYLFILAPVLWVSWVFSEPYFAFLSAGFLGFLVLGLLLCFVAGLFFKASTFSFSRYGYASIVFIWFGASLACMLVFQLYGLPISWIDAFFASVSGLTTTGIEVFPKLSLLPKSLLFFRVWLQFLGGMGIILMAVTAFSSGGLGLPHSTKLDLPGPVVSYSKKKPKLSDIARYLWIVYFSMTMLSVFCCKALGLTWFESFCESFSVISTGGYTVHDVGILHYHSSGLKIIMMFFMLFGSINFLLHYQFFILREYRGYMMSVELKGYLLALSLMLIFFVIGMKMFSDGPSILDIIFTVISLFSSSGFLSFPIEQLPSLFPYLLVMLGLVGGCAGSTSGGIKVIRIQFCYQEMVQACKLLIHPRVVLSNPAVSVGMSGSAVDSQSIIMRGFISGFIAFFLLSLLILTGLGLNFNDAFFSLVACLSNTGVFLSTHGSTLPEFSDAVKLWLAITMLFGRIEILAFFVVLSPSYWVE